jgi:hypothetical protein
MTRIIPFLLIFTVLCEAAFAQQPTFSLGESNPTTDFIPQKFIGETNSEYLVLSWVFGMSLSSALTNSVVSIKDLKMTYFDKSSLNKTKLLTFPEFQGDEISKMGKVVLEELEIKGDTLNLFTSTWDKEKKDYAIHVWALNSTTLEPLTPRAKLLARIEDNGRSDMKRVEIEYLKFINRFAIIYTEYTKKNKETEIHVILLDDKLNPIKNESLVMQGTKYGVGIRDIDVDLKGNIYFINAISDVRFPGWDDARWIRVSMIPAGGGSITSADIELTGGNPINGLISTSSNGNVFVCGYYAMLTDPKDGGKEFFGGSYVAQISPLSGEVIKVDELELSDNQKKALYVRSMNPNSPARSYYREMNSMVPKKLSVDEAGNTTMVGSVEYSVVTTSSRSSRITYFSNSMMISKFKSAGEIAWQMILPRAAYLSSMSYALYPLVYFDKGITYVLFNDDDNNMLPLSQIASGKKVNSSSSKGFKPKDYPPTDSDEIEKLDAWNIQRTALRLTAIDPTGNWKVNWLSPEGGEEKDKIPAIEGTVMLKDSQGSIITSMYTKYGSLGLRKSALARIKI